MSMGISYYRDVILAIILFVCALSLRMPGLLHVPNTLYGDETLNIQFAIMERNGVPYFDMHPPFMHMIYGSVLPAEVSAGAYGINGFSPVPDHSVLLWRMRFVSAIGGALLASGIFLLCRSLSIGVLASFLAGLFVVFDNALVLYGRTVLRDTLMPLFALMAVYVASGFVHTTRVIDRWLLVGGAGVFLGLAAAMKWTGVAALIPAAIPVLCMRARYVWGLVLVLLLTYGGTWLVHGLHTHGNASWVFPPYQVVAGATEIINKKTRGIAAEVAYIQTYHQVMLASHQSSELFALLPFSHRGPETWPFMKGGIPLWSDRIEQPFLARGDTSFWFSGERRIFNHGNAFLWYASSVSVLLLTVVLVRRFWKKEDGSRLYAPLLIVCGYVAHYLPFFFINRFLSNYHYFSALLFSFMAMAYLLDMLDMRQKNKIAAVLLGIVILFFVAGARYTYGL